MSVVSMCDVLIVPATDSVDAGVAISLRPCWFAAGFIITDIAQIVKVFVALSNVMISSFTIELTDICPCLTDTCSILCCGVLAIKYTMKEIDVRCSSSETMLK